MESPPGSFLYAEEEKPRVEPRLQVAVVAVASASFLRRPAARAIHC